LRRKFNLIMSRIELPDREVLDLFSILHVPKLAEREANVKKLLAHVNTTSKKAVLLTYYLRRTGRGLCTKSLNRRHSYSLLLTELLKLKEELVSPETVYDSLEKFAETADANEANQLLLGRITFLIVVSQAGRFAEIEEDTLIKLIEDTYAGFDKPWLQQYSYLALTNLLGQTAKADFQKFKNVCAKLLVFPDALGPWRVGLACRFFLICRSNGWQSDKIISLKAVKRLFKRKNQKQLQKTMQDCFDRNLQCLPDCYTDVMKWIVNVPEGWLLAKEVCLKQLAEAPKKQQFKFEGVSTLLHLIDSNCPFSSGSDIWDDSWTSKLNQAKNSNSFKKLPEFVAGLKKAIALGRPGFVSSFVSTLISGGLNASFCKEIADTIQSREDLDLSKEIDRLMQVQVEGKDVIDWQKACTSLNRLMQIPFLRKSHGEKVLQFLLRYGCFKTKTDNTDYEIQNMISTQVLSFMRNAPAEEVCDWQKPVVNLLAQSNKLRSVHVMVPTHVPQIYTLFQSCASVIEESKNLSKEQRACLLSLSKTFMVCAFTHLHELLFLSLQDYTLALQDISDPSAWTEFVEAVMHILFAVQHSDSLLLRDLAKRTYTTFAQDISADCLQVPFALILPQAQAEEDPAETAEAQDVNSGEVKYVSDEEEKLEKTALEKQKEEAEQVLLAQNAMAQEEEEDEVIDFTRLTTVLMEEPDIDLALARAVKTQIDAKRKLRNPSDYWVRLLDLVEVILSKNSSHGGIIAIIPSLIEIVRQRQESRAWTALAGRCRKFLLSISRLKQLGTDGLDKAIVMAIIEDAVKLVNRDTKELELLGKVLRLMNRCYDHCPETLDINTEEEAKEWLENNIEGKLPKLVDFWYSEIDLFLGRKRRNLQGVFYQHAIGGAPNVGWACIGHAMSKLTPDVRARLQLDCFEWLSHAMQRIGKCPEDQLKTILPALTQALPHVFKTIRNKKWKRSISKIVNRFIEMHSDEIESLGMWSQFDALKESKECAALYETLSLKRDATVAKLTDAGPPKKKRKTEGKKDLTQLLKEKKIGKRKKSAGPAVQAEKKQGKRKKKKTPNKRKKQKTV